MSSSSFLLSCLRITSNLSWDVIPVLSVTKLCLSTDAFKFPSWVTTNVPSPAAICVAFAKFLILPAILREALNVVPSDCAINVLCVPFARVNLCIKHYRLHCKCYC